MAYDYTITSNASSSSPVEEGGQITFTVTRNGSGSASTVYVTTNAANDTATPGSDFTSIASLALNFASNETVKTVTVDTLSDSVYEDDEYLYLILFKTEAALADFDYAAYGTGYIKNTNTLTSSLSSSASSIIEGETVNFTLTTNAAKDTEFDWSIAGVSSADVIGNLTGTVAVDTNGQAVIGVTLADDAAAEGSETMTLSVASQSSSVTIADTSTLTSSLSSSASSVNEGQTVNFTLTTNAAKDTEFDWSIAGISSNDAIVNLTGTVAVDTNGQAVIRVTLANDAATEGPETMTLSVASRSSSVTIADTSTSGSATIPDTSEEIFSFYPGTEIIKSISGGASTHFVLFNKTDNPVKVYWIDYDGVEHLYKTLNPSLSHTQGSYTNHLWEVRDLDGQALFKFYPSQPGAITAYNDSQEFVPALMGTAGTDQMLGTLGDDFLITGAGNDTANGGDGNDVANLPGNYKDYAFSYDAASDSFTLASLTHGTKILTSIETVKFSWYEPLAMDGLEQLLSFDVTHLQTNGESANHIDLVFLAEGYMASERASFLSAAASFMELMLGNANQRLNSPLSEYAALFNVTAIFTPSRESGIDLHLEGTLVNTVFDSRTYNSDGRLATGDENLVNFLLDHATTSDAREMVVVLMNSSLYAAGGGTSAWVAADNQYASHSILHETGHSYASLEDEYVDAEITSVHPISRLDSVHVSSSETDVPWSHWLGYEDELGTVGTYEGGYYRSTGIWRATPDSKMLHSNVPFSAPQKEAFIQRFYEAIGDYLSLSINNQDIQAKVPDVGFLSINWTINGEGAGQGERLSLASRMETSAVLDQTPASLNISVTTIDGTGMVREPAILAATEQTETLDLLIGSNKADRILGTSADDVIMAGDGNDSLTGGSGADLLHGGAGIDTAIYSGNLSDFTLTKGTDSWAITASDESDSVVNIERLQFTNTNVALDLDGNAGKTAKLLAVVLGAEGVSNKVYVGAGLYFLDGGMTYEELMQAALDVVLGANPSSSSVVDLLWANIVGPPTPADNLPQYSALIDNGTYTAAELAVAAADHSLNTTNIDLVGLSQTGLEYDLYG